MAAFEPSSVLAILVAAQDPAGRKKFQADYTNSIQKRVESWMKNRPKQSTFRPQLEFEAAVVQYVDYIHHATKPPRTTKKNTQIAPTPKLPSTVPLLGPHFLPPTFSAARMRSGAKVQPQTVYLRAVNIIHPVYYPELSKCPHCLSEDIKWDGWNASGSREVHGMRREETALGYQLRHENCVADNDSTQTRNRCFATTNDKFWVKWESWEVPRGIPHFRSRIAVTRELFNFIIEMRPTTTSGGLAENIKQFHLAEYHQLNLDYLRTYGMVHQQSTLNFGSTSFTLLSPPQDENGYNDDVITDELITDIYLNYCERTRTEESAEFLRNLRAITMSVDNTFKVSKKAVVVDSEDKSRKNLLKGGILSVLNELNLIIAWRFCQSESPSELTELLDGIKRRCTKLDVDLPEILVADNCCHIASSVRRSMPDIAICLDVHHFMMRYLGTVLQGTKNPLYEAVAKDIRDAILRQPAEKNNVAKYWPQAEQETKIKAAFDKWARKGVWSAAAQSVHESQLGHICKGCLSRPRDDVASDGSRIEGSHKGWNSLQRSFVSSITLQAALCADFVLRRNARISIARLTKAGAICTEDIDKFLLSTYGSHHLRLVNKVAELSNELTRRYSGSETPAVRPQLRIINSGEVFGVVPSEYVDTFAGLISFDDDEQKVNSHTLGDEELVAAVSRLEDAGIDPALLSQPLNLPSAVPSTSSELSARKRKYVDSAPESSKVGGNSDASTKRIRYSVSSEETSLLFVEAQIPESHTSGQQVENLFEGSSPMDCVPLSAGNSCLDPLSSTTSILIVESVPTPLAAPMLREGTSGERVVPPVLAPAVNAGVATQSVPKRATPSQRFFELKTGRNPRSLTLARGAEFFLFMRLRDEMKWKSFSMTSVRWVEATARYNTVLKEMNPDSFVKKAPQALVEALGLVEQKILLRIANKDYKSQKNTETFWKHHCHAVELVKDEGKGKVKSEPKDGEAPKKARSAAVCKRCNKIMYPGPSGSPENHKLGYCSDGFKQKPDEGESAPWPQPAGIFSSGKKFHPRIFLTAFQETFEILVVQKDAAAMTLEQEAFCSLLKTPGRIISSPSNGTRQLFKLFKGYDIAETDIPDSYFELVDEITYLCLDALN